MINLRGILVLDIVTIRLISSLAPHIKLRRLVLNLTCERTQQEDVSDATID